MKLKFFSAALAVMAVVHTSLLYPLLYACAPIEDYFDSPPFLEYGHFDALLNTFIPDARGYHEEQMLCYDDYLQALNKLCASKDMTPFQKESLPEVSYTGDLPSNSYESVLTLVTTAFKDLNDKDALVKLVQVRHKILFLFKEKAFQETLPQEIAALPGSLGHYKTYLEGAFYFYKGDYEKAAPLFKKIHETLASPSLVERAMTVLGLHQHQAWLEASSLYLEGRAYLLAAQKNMDGYENEKERAEKLNQPLLERAFVIFKRYQEKYPQGLYVQSAHDLERRYLFLAGKHDALNGRLVEDLTGALASKDGRRIHQLFREFRFYFGGKIDPNTAHPLIVALMLQTRSLPEEESGKTYLEYLTALKAREKDFASYPHLHTYLKARALALLKKDEELLALEATLPTSLEDILPLTTQALKVEAALSLNKPDAGLKILEALSSFWRDDTSDLLRMRAHLLRKSPPSEVLRAFTQEKLQTLYLEHLVSFEDLESLSQNKTLPKDLLTSTRKALMQRLLLSASYEKAVALNDLLKSEGAPPIPDAEASAMKTLITDPTHPDALMTLGRFMMQDVSYPDSQPFAYELEGLCPECKIPTQEGLLPQGRVVPPLDYFMKTAAVFAATKEKNDLEAEALYYLASVCFHGSADARSCLWRSTYNLPEAIEDIHKNKVPKWFARLHRLYPGTKWALMGKYYY
ncbi:MAG: hypothetical protein ACK5TR_08565 [Alphaproteobacteria bacterium]|jgi:hypothetical protein|nr:hypothetical protein [Alphaproteobacteria bacterium]